MRMFLVGMCDIFLILYLTTLGQIDERALSPLTVTDYEELQSELEQSRETLKELEERLALLSKQKGSSEEEQKKLQEQIAALTSSLEKGNVEQKEENASLEQQLNRLKSLFEQEKEARAKEQKDLAAIEQAKAKELEKKAKELAALKEQLAEQESLEQRLALLNKEKSQLEKKAREAEQRKKDAEERAEKHAEEAAAAKVAATEAKRLASTATGVALQNRVNAYLAGEDARIAEREVVVAQEEVKKTQKVIQSITQESQEAIEEKIKPDTLRLLWDMRRENVLLGSSSYKKSLRVIPVRDGSYTFVIVPLEQLEIEFDDSSDRYRRMNASIGGQKVKELRISPDGRLLAFSVPRGLAVSARRFIDTGSRQTLMPTLIALRNLSQLPFADRIRDVSEDFFVFNRDRLSKERGSYVYRARGVRGTGDYAGRILPGDTIVDLEGNVFGVAHDINRVQAINRTSTWKTVSLTQDPASVMRTLKQHVGK